MRTDDITAVQKEVTEKMQGLANARIALPAGHSVSAAAEGATFCNLWPIAKAVLEEIKSRVGGLIAVAIGIVIKAGDSICGTAAAPAKAGVR